jgi:Zn-dependent protease with chaperone function
MTASRPPYAFAGTIEPTRLPAAYRFGLMIVGAAMLLLPLVYLGSIALTARAVWWHLTTNAGILGGRGNAQGRLLVYVGPALVGLVLMFFMVKPILARPSRERDPIPLDPGTEPVLIAFIQAICRQVRAPMPRRVQVDCQVNASAGFMRQGVAGVLSNDLVLTIGLPLVAGLTVRQLGGVLAHEFGHFAQGGGMRLTAIVRGVNAWFARVVFERDEWDLRLEEWSKNLDGRVAILLMLAKGAIWVSRQMLRGLMLTGHAISCFMLRQMEFDADSYEIKITGSETFGQTSRRMREMNVGAQFGYADLRSSLRTGKLPSHLPAFVVQRTGCVPRDVLDQVRNTADERTGMFDTHPCDADRLRAARKAAAPGVMAGGDGPASVLFRDFEALSAAATRHHYEHDLGIGLEAVALIDTDEAVRHSSTRDQQREAFQAFFGGSASPRRPLVIPESVLEWRDRDRLRVVWAEARRRMTGHMARVAEQYREFEALEDKRDAVFTAQELFSAGFSKLKAEEFELPDGTPEGVRKADREYEVRQRALIRAFDAFEASVRHRLAAALALAGDEPGREQTRSLVTAANALAGAMALGHELRRLESTWRTLAHNAAGKDRNEQVAERAELISAMISKRCSQLEAELTGVACPPALGGRQMSMAERCGLRAANRDAAAEIGDEMLWSYYEIMCRLAAAALSSEARLDAERPGVAAGSERAAV